MRKLLLGIGVLALIASQASALDLPANTPLSGSITDRSNVFSGTGDFKTPEGILQQINIGDEQRNVFSMDALSVGVVEVNPFSGDVRITETGPNITFTPKNLKGLLYDLNVSGFSAGVPTPGGGPTDIYKVPGNRYTDALGPDGIAMSGDEGVDGIWTDNFISPLVGAATSALGYGGILVVYEDPTPGDPANPFAGGAAAWREPGQPGHVASPIAGTLTNSDTYPGISDQGIPWLVAVVTPLPAYYMTPAGTVLLEDNFEIDLGQNSSGAGTAFLNIIGGSAASMFLQDVFGPGRDIRIDFEVDGDFNGTPDGWQLQSDDPVQFATSGIIPEPTTLALFGIGLAGLRVIRRRK